MRKRNIKKLADTIFWYVVYLLPIILTVIQSIGIFGNFNFDNWEYIYASTSVSDYDCMYLLEHNLIALGSASGGMIYDTFTAIFGNGGILPIIYQPAIFGFSQWVVATMLIHLCVDFILFIPRLAHKWMDTLTKED